jgi:tRNA pseudouridine synthase 10
MGRRVRFRGADVTVLVDPLAGRAEVRSRPVYVVGRYVKTRRGLPQRQAKCEVCRGRGCDTCQHTGRGPEPSIEGLLRQLFRRAFHARDAIFTWLGSEDEDSLVLGRGRPFSAEILDPERRRLPRRLAKRVDGVRLTTLRIAKARPAHPRDFTGHFRLLVETAAPISSAKLREVETTFRDRPVAAFSPRKQKLLTKHVYTARATRRGPRRLELLLKTDGGLNLKKFVSGGPSDSGPAQVAPNIATVLGASATCVRFDVLAIVPRALARHP